MTKTKKLHPEPKPEEQPAADQLPVTEQVQGVAEEQAAVDEPVQEVAEQQAIEEKTGAPVAQDESAEEGELSLTAQLEQAESRAEEYLDSLKRERASFQNYKKRVENERAEQRRLATSSVLIKLLPILDDFHRAMDAIPDEQRNDWFEGVAMIQRKLDRFMQDEGVTEIDALGQEFDPNFHEAVGVDTDSDATSGTITVVLQRGYQQGDRVLRPAMVRVAD